MTTPRRQKKKVNLPTSRSVPYVFADSFSFVLFYARKLCTLVKSIVAVNMAHVDCQVMFLGKKGEARKQRKRVRGALAALAGGAARLTGEEKPRQHKITMNITAMGGGKNDLHA